MITCSEGGVALTEKENAMIGHLINWFSTQFSFSGPFAYSVDKGWISPDLAAWINATFFGPLNFAAEHSEWLQEQLSTVIEAWQKLPF